MATPLGGAGILAAGDLLSGLLAPSQTAGSNINLTKTGANQYLQDLMSGKGLGVVGQGDVGNAFNAANTALQGDYSRSLGLAGRGAGAQSAASGVANPYSWIQHAQSGVTNQFGNQFGNLETQRAMAMLENLYKTQGLRTQLIGLGGNTVPQTPVKPFQSNYQSPMNQNLQNILR